MPPNVKANQSIEQIGIDAIHPTSIHSGEVTVRLMLHTRPDEIILNNTPIQVSPDVSEIILKSRSSLKCSTPPNASLQACLVIEYDP